MGPHGDVYSAGQPEGEEDRSLAPRCKTSANPGILSSHFTKLHRENHFRKAICERNAGNPSRRRHVAGRAHPGDTATRSWWRGRGNEVEMSGFPLLSMNVNYCPNAFAKIKKSAKSTVPSPFRSYLKIHAAEGLPNAPANTLKSARSTVPLPSKSGEGSMVIGLNVLGPRERLSRLCKKTSSQ